MGFFSGIGRVIAGKPIFTPEDRANKQDEAPIAQVQSQDANLQVGPKQIPQLSCGRVESQNNSGRCDVYVDVHNQSDAVVFIDDVQLLGTKRELQRQLRPGEAHQELLYSGPMLMIQPNGYTTFRYRTQADGDYFQSQFQIRFERESDGSYRITELRPAGLVKDI